MALIMGLKVFLVNGFSAAVGSIAETIYSSFIVSLNDPGTANV
jgi:sRNA-binding regulator protein Hfq